MKKFLFSVLAIGLGFVGVSNAFYTYGDPNLCNFNDAEVQRMATIHDLIENYADAIEAKYPGTEHLVWDYLAVLEESLECFGPNGFKTYKEFELGTVSFLKEVANYKGPSDLAVDSEAEEAILQLQKHLVDMLGQGVDYSKVFSQTADANLSVNFQDPYSEESFALDLDLNTDGVFDLKDEEFEVNVKLDASVDFVQNNFVDYDYSSNPYGDAIYEQQEGNVSVTADIDLLQKDDLFVKLNDLDADISSSEMDEDSLMAYEMVKNMYLGVVDSIKGQYINVTDGLYEEFGQELNMVNTMGVKGISEVMNNLETKPLMKFEKTEIDNQRQGVFDENVCLVFGPLAGDYSDDCEEFLDDNLAWSEGLPYLVMKKQGSDFVLGIDEFVAPSEEYENLIQWNTSEIKKIEFPLDVYGNFVYENGNLNINYDDGFNYFVVDGDLDATEKVINLYFVVEGVNIEGVVKYYNVSNVYNLSAEFDMYEDEEWIGSFALTDKEVIKYLSDLSVEAPQYAKTIEEVMESFGSALDFEF